ncbi:nucleotide exchange factor GrpE [Alicyclobacillus dauci]|uniref:Protein GrpE n=1 Tax=Alicyclobacillus dauci TaxID=1475485 RepID=A0ABY6Z6M9_9BACL|nr:nucleotide exchange factor GrpE [Alicyclobacillus dauci]WAH38536.1 nucleotide exchange factor GrpE [Alicyclobacillus dauci]
MADEKDLVEENNLNDTQNQSDAENDAVEAEVETIEADAEVTADDAGQDPKDAEIESLQQQLLRVRADFDNFRRRTRQEKEELSQFATRKLLADLLPIVDNFDRALAAEDGADDQLRTGIEMVHRQLTQVLSQHGVEPMKAQGETFDPVRHEAVMQESVDGTEPNVVLQELQKGYMLHDKVLRPAMVKVSV